MKYPTINLQGNILSAELLEELDQEASHQGPNSFGLPSGARVKDEIARAWSEARLQWQIFGSKRERLREGATGATETRQFWIIPLLDALGYRLEVSQKAEVVNGQTYAVSHRDPEIGGFPVHIMGVNDFLDRKRTTGGPRLSPHGLVQEYLNLTEHLYAIVTNGTQLRLLRDSSRLTRLSYLEFDLVKMMDEEAYADFAVMYRLLHRSRMPQQMEGGDESIVEVYHQLGLEAGARIREGLSKAVKEGITRFGNTLLQDVANEKLRQHVSEGALDAKGFYNQLLRLVYRLLFLLVVEERDLVFGADMREANGAARMSHRDVYREFYSVSRMRRQAENLRLTDGRRHDLWQGLLETFSLFENSEQGAHLGISPLVGELFGADAIPDLVGARCRNDVLLYTLDQLCRFRNKQGEWVRVNYAALNVEEFGSVYEGLLEFEPVVEQGDAADSGRGWSFGFRDGSERATTGSHYTPDELVRPLVEHALDPVIERHLKADGGSHEADERVLLGLKVCDIACGSGHFLLAAARRIAFLLARTRTGEEQPAPAALRAATRDVIAHCIYGVDINPMAVELCKVALWLEAHVPGMPLTFLDHRIKCGDAVVGVARFEDLKDGVPDEAFKTLEGDEKDAAAELRKRNKEERKARGTGRGLQLELGDDLEQGVQSLADQFAALDRLGDDSPQAVHEKEARYRELAAKHAQRFRVLADVMTAQNFLPKTWDSRSGLCTDLDFRRALGGASTLDAVVAQAAASESRARRFFHWFVEFPDVLAVGGFDCIIGNPPYLGGTRITTNYGKRYLAYLKACYPGAGDRCDLCAYFVRRAVELLSVDSSCGFITTNSISEGDTLAGGLKRLVDDGTEIVFAEVSLKWPGRANVTVTLFSLFNGTWRGDRKLDGRIVDAISSSLTEGAEEMLPRGLPENSGIASEGSKTQGLGFVLDMAEGKELQQSGLNHEVVRPYLTGQDVLSSPTQSASRYVIDFRDLDEEDTAVRYPQCFEIVRQRVKSERQRRKEDGSYQLRSPLPQRWWQHGEKRKALYDALVGVSEVIVVSRVAKYLIFARVETGQVFSERLVVIVSANDGVFPVLQSNVHEVWAWKYGSTLESRLMYRHGSVLATFPFPVKNAIDRHRVEELGVAFHQHRASAATTLNVGLTDLYNMVHDPAFGLGSSDGAENTEGSSHTGIVATMREHQVELDYAVCRAYGWEDLDLGHGFHEVDFLPENDRTRFTLGPKARKEILKRLLKLNLARAD